MSKLIGPELQCTQVSYLFHFGFLGPHYFLQISNTTFSRRFRWNIGPSLLFRRFFGSIIIAGLLFSFQRAPYFGLSSHCFQYRFRKSVIYTYRQYKSFIKSPDNLMLSFCSITSMHVHGHGKQLF